MFHKILTLTFITITLMVFGNSHSLSIQGRNVEQPELLENDEIQQSTGWLRNDDSAGHQNGEPTMPPKINSILPNPNGPFYGFPFDLSATFSRNLPFTISGFCEPGKMYTIKRPEDILDHQTELECVFNTGRAPTKIPTGAMFGTVISAINTRLFNQLVGTFWKGKSINKTECHGNTAYIGWNNVMGHPSAPFVARLASTNLKLAPGEYDNGRAALILEYGIDVPQACPEYRSHLLENHGRAAMRGASFSASSLIPTNHMVEVFRFLGKQEDGGDIYLGKTLLKDAYREDKQAATIAYSVLINYDQDANPLNIAGLPSINVPSTQGYKYMHPGIVDFVFRINPIDNFFTTPFRTLNKLIRGAVKTGTDSLLFAQTLPLGLRNFRRNSQSFKNRFYNDANAIRQMSNRAPAVIPILKPQPLNINNNNANINNNRGRTDNVEQIPLPQPQQPQPSSSVVVFAEAATSPPITKTPAVPVKP